MMNRSTTSNDPFPSPFFPFAGLPPNNTTTWDPNPNPNPNPSMPSFNYSYPSSFIPNTPPYLDSQAGLMPISSFPIATDQMYTVKAEEVGLNLGHRTYFSSGDAAAIDRLFARSRGVYSLAHQPPRCQAEGCKADLSGAKHYHRRHKVCEFHSKATVVIASGLQQRFCQQCSRFHVLSEFDEAKRSCRKRLADHNRRRRKPQSQSTNSSENNNSSNTTTTTTTTTTSTTAATISKTTNGPGLSLGAGGVGGLINQNQCSTFVSQEQTSSSNTHLYHNSSLFWSSSNEASQSNGGDSDQQHHQQQQQSNNLLHLGQAMFELDFL